MTRQEAKDLFNSSRDSYGKPRKIMTTIDKIYDDFESRTCDNCKFLRTSTFEGNPYPGCTNKENGELASEAIHGAGCNRWKAKND